MSSNTSPPSIATYAEKIFDTMEKAKDQDLKKPPDELLHLIQTKLGINDVPLTSFSTFDLETIFDIANFGKGDLPGILTNFPLAQLSNPVTIQFIKTIYILTNCFKNVGENLEQLDINSSPNPQEHSYLKYLPNTKAESNLFLNSIQDNIFKRYARQSTRKFPKELKEYTEKALTSLQPSTDPILGSTISVKSLTSRGVIVKVITVIVKVVTVIVVKIATIINQALRRLIHIREPIHIKIIKIYIKIIHKNQRTIIKTSPQS